MSEPLNPGTHPDPDSLSAFLEGVLPEHERLACLAHFAQCPSCREIVFLAQEPAPVAVAPKLAPSWRRWFTPVAVLSGAAACALVAAVTLFPRHAPLAPVRALVASVKAPVPSVQIPAAQPRAELESAEVKKKPPRAMPSPAVTASSPISAPEPAPASTIARNAEPLSAPAPVPPPSLQIAGSNQSALPSAGPLRLRIQHEGGSLDGFSEVDGSVTDPLGAGIPGATVTLGQLSGTRKENARTDANGKFAIPAVPAGKYELHIVAAGFQDASGQIDLQAQDIATVAPVLSIGSVSNTVEVSASAGSMLQTAPVPQPTKSLAEPMRMAPRISAAVALPPSVNMPPDAHPLPSKLPVVTSATSGKHLLATDSAGALFYSGNAGKSWKAVKSVWLGKLVRLVPSGDGFQLTTDSGSTWLSQDGLHWRQAPSQH